MLSALITIGTGLAITGLGAIVALLWNLNGLVATQNGTLARVVAEFDTHRQENREDFQTVHARLDALD